MFQSKSNSESELQIPSDEIEECNDPDNLFLTQTILSKQLTNEELSNGVVEINIEIIEEIVYSEDQNSTDGEYNDDSIICLNDVDRKDVNVKNSQHVKHEIG